MATQKKQSRLGRAFSDTKYAMKGMFLPRPGSEKDPWTQKEEKKVSEWEDIERGSRRRDPKRRR